MNTLRRGGGRLDYQGWSAKKTEISKHCVVSKYTDRICTITRLSVYAQGFLGKYLIYM